MLCHRLDFDVLAAVANRSQSSAYMIDFQGVPASLTGDRPIQQGTTKE